MSGSAGEVGLNYFVDEFRVVVSVLFGLDLECEAQVVVVVDVEPAGLLWLVEVEVVDLVSLQGEGRDAQALVLVGFLDALFGRSVELVEDSQVGDVLVVVPLPVLLLQRKLSLIQQLRVGVAAEVLIVVLHLQPVASADARINGVLVGLVLPIKIGVLFDLNLA
jgi:hypothetical protein